MRFNARTSDKDDGIVIADIDFGYGKIDRCSPAEHPSRCPLPVRCYHDLCPVLLEKLLWNEQFLVPEIRWRDNHQYRFIAQIYHFVHLVIIGIIGIIIFSDAPGY